MSNNDDRRGMLVGCGDAAPAALPCVLLVLLLHVPPVGSSPLLDRPTSICSKARPCASAVQVHVGAKNHVRVTTTGVGASRLCGVCMDNNNPNVMLLS